MRRGGWGGAARKRFLLHVESQARSKLEEERKIINQLEEVEWSTRLAA